jgi:hypothetical protein
MKPSLQPIYLIWPNNVFLVFYWNCHILHITLYFVVTFVSLPTLTYNLNSLFWSDNYCVTGERHHLPSEHTA